MIKECVLLVAILAFNGWSGAEGKFDVKLPYYFPHENMERLLEARRADFYKKFEDDAVLAINFMDNEENIALLQDMERDEEDPTCIRALLRMFIDYQIKRSYALQMRDANGRKESGLYKGNWYWFGRFYECQNALGPSVTPKYNLLILSDQENATFGLTTAMCLPDVCEPDALAEVFQKIVSNNGSTFATVYQPPDTELDGLDIFAIVLYSFFIALIVGGTIVHVTLNIKSGTKSMKLVESSRMNTLSVPAKLALSFSAIQNTRILLDTNRKEGNLDALDGIRFLSITWIILGHSLSSIGFVGGTDNLIDAYEYMVGNGSTLGITNGTFSVDTFFVLSGLLVAYLGLKEMDKTNGKINIPLMYLSRYIRLTPCMAAVMLFSVSIADNVGHGPTFDNSIQLYSVEPCQKYWWPNLLYINNLYPVNPNDECISWVWYLANDMQFYLLSPIFLYLFYRSPKAAFTTIGIIIVISASITGALSTVYDLYPDAILIGYSINYFLQLDFTGESNTTAEPLGPSSSEKYFDDIYVKPWCRIGVYVIGLTTGYVIHVTKRKIRMNKIVAISIWIAVITTGAAIIYCFWGSINHLDLPSRAVMSFYSAVSRPLWGMCVSWVIIACVSGYGGPVNSFLSWKGFVPLSRLTYCAYMTHGIVLLYIYAAREVEFHFQPNSFIGLYLAVLPLSFTMAYILHMMIEAPTAGIMRVLLPKRRNHQEKPNRNGNVTANGMYGRGSISDPGIDNADVIKCEKL